MEIYGVKNAGYVATPNYKSNFSISNFALTKNLELRIKNPDTCKENVTYEFDFESDVENMYECIRNWVIFLFSASQRDEGCFLEFLFFLQNFFSRSSDLTTTNVCQLVRPIVCHQIVKPS